MEKKSMKNVSKPQLAFSFFNYIFLVLLSLAFIIPFIVIFSSSLLTEQEAAKLGSYVLFAPNPDFNAYRTILSSRSLLLNAYGITILRVLIGTALNLIFTTMLAYGLANTKVPGRNFFMALILITMFFGGGLIPYFLLLKNMGLYNNFWVMVIPGLISPWNMILMRNFFQQIPKSLEESATVDGATPLRILVEIIIPVSKPVMATMTLFYAVGHWNTWFDAMMYINKNTLWPLQLLLKNIMYSSSAEGLDINFLAEIAVKPPSNAVKCAVIIVTTVPVLCIYPFLQKYFVGGIMVGSLKG